MIIKTYFITLIFRFVFATSEKKREERKEKKNEG